LNSKKYIEMAGFSKPDAMAQSYLQGQDLLIDINFMLGEQATKDA